MAEGTVDIRQALFEELKDKIVDLAKDKYSSFFVQKLLNYGSTEQKAHILKSFEGKVAEMTKHKVANTVIETCYNDVANAPQRNRYSTPTTKPIRDSKIQQNRILSSHCMQNLPVLLLEFSSTHLHPSFFMLHDKKSEFWSYLAGEKVRAAASFY